MKTVKAWTWRNDLKWLFYYYPIEFIRSLYGIAEKDHILNEMSWQSYLGFAESRADMRAGRFYKVVFE